MQLVFELQPAFMSTLITKLKMLLISNLLNIDFPADTKQRSKWFAIYFVFILLFLLLFSSSQ